jgi:hypothetical protein
MSHKHQVFERFRRRSRRSRYRHVVEIYPPNGTWDGCRGGRCLDFLIELFPGSINVEGSGFGSGFCVVRHFGLMSEDVLEDGSLKYQHRNVCDSRLDVRSLV